MKKRGEKRSTKQATRFVEHCCDCREDIIRNLKTVAVARADGSKRPMTPTELRNYAKRYPTRRKMKESVDRLLRKHRNLFEGSGPRNENRTLWSFLHALAQAAIEGDAACGEALRMMAHWSLGLRLAVARHSTKNVKLENHVATLIEAVNDLNASVKDDSERFRRIGATFSCWPVNLRNKNESFKKAKELLGGLEVGERELFSKVNVTSPLSRLALQWLQEVDSLIFERQKRIGMGGKVLEDWGAWPGYLKTNAPFYARKFEADFLERRKGIAIHEWKEFKQTANRTAAECRKAIEDAFASIFGQIEKLNAQRESGN